MLKNVLIVSKDIKKAAYFYKDLFGLEIIRANEGNVILTEGLVIQDENIWIKEINSKVIPQNNKMLLYFEVSNMKEFIDKLENTYNDILYLTPYTILQWGQGLVRFYDYDMNLIEVRD